MLTHVGRSPETGQVIRSKAAAGHPDMQMERNGMEDDTFVFLLDLSKPS